MRRASRARPNASHATRERVARQARRGQNCACPDPSRVARGPSCATSVSLASTQRRRAAQCVRHASKAPSASKGRALPSPARVVRTPTRRCSAQLASFPASTSASSAQQARAVPSAPLSLRTACQARTLTPRGRKCATSARMACSKTLGGRRRARRAARDTTARRAPPSRRRAPRVQRPTPPAFLPTPHAFPSARASGRRLARRLPSLAPPDSTAPDSVKTSFTAARSPSSSPSGA
jgi:hypothetical protein